MWSVTFVACPIVIVLLGPGAFAADSRLDTLSHPSTIHSASDSTVCWIDDDPKIVSRPKITWPDGIVSSATKVKVVCRVKVDTLGIVRYVQVDFSENARFDKAAKQLARQYRFEPRDQGGVKREFWVSIPFNFRKDVPAGQ